MEARVLFLKRKYIEAARKRESVLSLEIES